MSRKKFDIGEKVVLITETKNLELNSVYIVKDYPYKLSLNDGSWILILEETNIIYGENRFISLTEFRKRKINKLIKLWQT